MTATTKNKPVANIRKHCVLADTFNNVDGASSTQAVEWLIIDPKWQRKLHEGNGWTIRRFKEYVRDQLDVELVELADNKMSFRTLTFY